MNQIPYVTVIVPTYNRADYLDRLLVSVSNQTYKNFEVIVVDDHSQDQDAYHQVISKYASRFSLRYVSNEKNSGAPFSRNRGIALAKGELLAFVDDDDEWGERKLEKQVPLFKDPDVGITYTWASAVDENNNPVYQFEETVSGDARKEILKRCFIPSSSVMTTKKAAQAVGGFDLEFPSCQDWDMWTRIIFKKYRIQVLPEDMMTYHKHKGPSIGTGKSATKGYQLYYRKHLWKYVFSFTFSKDIKLVAIAFLRAFR